MFRKLLDHFKEKKEAPIEYQIVTLSSDTPDNEVAEKLKTRGLADVDTAKEVKEYYRNAPPHSGDRVFAGVTNFRDFWIIDKKGLERQVFNKFFGPEYVPEMYFAGFIEGLKTGKNFYWKAGTRFLTKRI